MGTKQIYFEFLTDDEKKIIIGAVMFNFIKSRGMEDCVFELSSKENLKDAEF